MGVIKKSIRTLISAGTCALQDWPLAARHLGERRLRNQLNALGWPVGKLVKFGAKAYALRKSWQARYAPWREVREEVTVLGPDVFSSLTSAGYYVRSTSTGRCFFTDDALLPETSPALENQEPETMLYLPERDPQAPVRRHHHKSAPQALSMLHIEGEQAILEHCAHCFEPDEVCGASSDSWTIGTAPASSSESSPRVIDFEEEEWWIGGGNEEGVPNTWAGGSHPATPNQRMLRAPALRRLHLNITNCVKEEMEHIDASSTSQTLWMPVVTEAILSRVALEEQLLSMTEVEIKDEKAEGGVLGHTNGGEQRCGRI